MTSITPAIDGMGEIDMPGAPLLTRATFASWQQDRCSTLLYLTLPSKVDRRLTAVRGCP
jgi:hypothetical protein